MANVWLKRAYFVVSNEETTLELTYLIQPLLYKVRMLRRLLCPQMKDRSCLCKCALYIFMYYCDIQLMFIFFLHSCSGLLCSDDCVAGELAPPTSGLCARVTGLRVPRLPRAKVRCQVFGRDARVGVLNSFNAQDRDCVPLVKKICADG
jgi:hypothetical protein